MKTLSLACALLCFGGSVSAATISGTEFAAVVQEGTNFTFGPGTALDDPAACDPATGTGCDISLGDYSIDFVDEDTFELGFFDANRVPGSTSDITFNLVGLTFMDGASPVAIDGVTFVGASGTYGGTPTADFTASSIEILISNFTGENFGTSETLRFDISTVQSISPVPLPASLGLLGAGILGLVLLRRRSTKPS